MYNKLFFTLVMSCSAGMLFAQQTKDSFQNIKLVEDPNISKFYPSAKSVAATTIPTQAKGYRIQIFDANNRAAASDVKAEFMKKYPGIRSYIHFHNPQYRVRIGDFLTREEAELFQEQIKKDFYPSMVIPDLINSQNNKNKSN